MRRAVLDRRPSCSVARGPQVLVVLDDPSLPDSIVRVLQAGFGCLSEVHEIFAMVLLRLLESAFVTQSGASVYARDCSIRYRGPPAASAPAVKIDLSTSSLSTSSNFS